jgi:hypothetical protein
MRGYFAEMKKRGKNIYFITEGDDSNFIGAFKSLHSLIGEYPNIPYYSAYRSLVKDKIYYYKEYILRKIVLF